MGAGLSLLVVFGITDYKRRRNCAWLQELQRIENEEQAEALSRKKMMICQGGCGSLWLLCGEEIS